MRNLVSLYRKTAHGDDAENGALQLFAEPSDWEGLPGPKEVLGGCKYTKSNLGNARLNLQKL